VARRAAAVIGREQRPAWPEWRSLTESIDLRRASVADIAEHVWRLPEGRRRKLLSECSTRDMVLSIARSKDGRVGYAKSIVALLPWSEAALTRLLATTVGEHLAHVQFALFCFLDDTLALPRARASHGKVLEALERFLKEVRSPRAHSAWMAGDLLGDHWPLHDSLPILLRIASLGRFVAGREGALHGLSHALARASKRQQWEIVNVLKQVRDGDRSKHVQKYADLLLGEMRGF